MHLGEPRTLGGWLVEILTGLVAADLGNVFVDSRGRMPTRSPFSVR